MLCFLLNNVVNLILQNGAKPDFSRNPFSRQQGFANGNAYQATGAAFSGQSQIPAASVFTPQPSVAVQQFAHAVVPPVQTSIQLPEQWQPHTNSQIHHQNSRLNSSNTQHFTTQMTLNANTVANYNRVPSNTGWADPEPFPPSRSVTPPHSTKLPQSLYLQNQTVSSSSLRSRQSFEPNHPYQNNRAVNNYNAYPAGPVRAAGSASSSTWGARNNLVERPEYESWSPDNSTSRRHEYSSGQYHNEPSGASRNGYRQRKAMPPSGYRDGENKRWQDHRR